MILETNDRLTKQTSCENFKYSMWREEGTPSKDEKAKGRVTLRIIF